MVAAPTIDDVDLEQDMVDETLSGGRVLSGIEDEGDAGPVVTIKGSGSELDRTTTSGKTGQWDGVFT